MSSILQITTAQLNLTVGDITGNLKKLIHHAEEAKNKKSDMIIFPELSLSGYSPQDLLLRPAFLEAEHQALMTFKEKITGIHCVLGHLQKTPKGLMNACSMIYNGSILGQYFKHHLPSYSIFDECRYFVPGNAPCVIPVKGIPIGMVICEDLWFSGPVQQTQQHGARIIVAPNASPFEKNKHERRLVTLMQRARENRVPIFYVNCVGGQDEIIFDGGSMVISEEAEVCHQADFFAESITQVHVEISNTKVRLSNAPILSYQDDKKLYDALVFSLKEYVRKNNFKQVLLGVSGGIDSALVLAIAVDALGANNVHALFLPSQHTSPMSIEDAKQLVENLHVKYDSISIEPMYHSFLSALNPLFPTQKLDITEENLQARCRGVILMALSNKLNKMVLTTGNRSEMAVGYATLYGDMVGGFNVLKDVYKTEVYRLATYRNQISPIIPERILTRAPSAELAPNQTDQDSLPPYEILDQILELYLDQDLDLKEIVSKGFDPDMTSKIINLVKKSEYKRQQAPLGARVNQKAFGRDRRYPITSKW